MTVLELSPKHFKRGIEKFIHDEKYTGVEIPSEEKIMSLVGQPSHIFFKELFPLLSQNECQKLSPYCVESLNNAVCAREGLLYNGIIELLEFTCTKRVQSVRCFKRK